MAILEVVRGAGGQRRPLIPYLRHNALAMAMMCLVILVALLGAEGAYRLFLRTQPTDRWVEYHSVEFVREEPEARDGLGGLRFVSDAQFKRDGFVEWNDVLRCRTDGVEEFVFYASYSSEAQLTAGPRDRSRWVFNAPYPSDPEALCLLQSTITVTANGVSKDVMIDSGIFTPVS